jgi:hypothetical protein
MKMWATNLCKYIMSPINYRFWLPCSFYYNWSDSEIFQKSVIDPTIALTPIKRKETEHNSRLSKLLIQVPTLEDKHAEVVAGNKDVRNI